MPYRIENTAGLNVSLRLTFHTRRSLRQQNIHRANLWLQSLMLDRFSDDRIDGVMASLKNHLTTLFPQTGIRAVETQPDAGFTLKSVPLDASRRSGPPPVSHVTIAMPGPGMVMEN